MGFVLGGYCLGGYCPGGYCLGGYCPDTVFPTPIPIIVTNVGPFYIFYGV